MTSKEKLEQLGWKIINRDDGSIRFEVVPIFDRGIIIEYNKKKYTFIKGWLELNELQLILDYIKEQEK